jgi:hypothetical protein
MRQPIEVNVSPTYREDVRTVGTATPPGRPDGQPTVVSAGGYVKEPPPKIPHPDPVLGGLSAPEGLGSGVPPLGDQTPLPPYVEGPAEPPEEPNFP